MKGRGNTNHKKLFKVNASNEELMLSFVQHVCIVVGLYLAICSGTWCSIDRDLRDMATAATSLRFLIITLTQRTPFCTNYQRNNCYVFLM